MRVARGDQPAQRVNRVRPARQVEMVVQDLPDLPENVEREGLPEQADQRALWDQLVFKELEDRP